MSGPISRALLFAVSLACLGQKVHDIPKATGPIQIDGKLDEQDWQQAASVGDFDFPWFTTGQKERTVAKLLWDDENLYVSWYAYDKHISASITQRHGPVSKDDCVEIFISPNPDKVKNYYTFEINAIGTMLNRARTDWWTGPPTWEPDGVQYRTTFHGRPKKDEAASDEFWIVEAAIPLRNFAKDAAHTPPQDGDRWRLNLQRLGGITNAQSSTWAPLPQGIKSFHTPEAFGHVRFVSRPRQAGAETVSQGRELFNRSCTMCHGQEGTVGDRGPALAGQRRYLRTSESDLFEAIKRGIPGTLMPGSPMPESDVAKVVSYIRSLRATAIDMPADGDVEKGRQIFAGKGRCSECHMLNGRGGLMGPDLSNVANSRSVVYLREALTVPKADIPKGFVPVRVVTADGKTIRGVVRNEHNFSLQILGDDGKLHLLDRAELKAVEYGKKSLMPADFGKTLTAAELQDLLAFLSRQGTAGAAAPRRRR